MCTHCFHYDANELFYTITKTVEITTKKYLMSQKPQLQQMMICNNRLPEKNKVLADARYDFNFVLKTLKNLRCNQAYTSQSSSKVRNIDKGRLALEPYPKQEDIENQERQLSKKMILLKMRRMNFFKDRKSKQLNRL